MDEFSGFHTAGTAVINFNNGHGEDRDPLNTILNQRPRHASPRTSSWYRAYGPDSAALFTIPGGLWLQSRNGSLGDRSERAQIILTGDGHAVYRLHRDPMLGAETNVSTT